jgi:GGDEF domain-containing protein
VVERAIFRALRPAYMPAAILVTAAVAIGIGSSLPPSLSGLTVFGPYIVLLIGVAISLWFNRGRAFVALGSLLLAYSAYSLTHDYAPGSFAERAVFTGIAFFVPLNVLLALVLPERGVSHHHNYRWLLLAAAEVMLVAWIASAGRSSFSGTSWHHILDHWLLRSPPAPLVARIMFACAFVAAAARAWVEADATELRPMDIGLAGGTVAFLLACEWVQTSGAFGAYMSAGGVILLVSLLQESHRMAFNDPLTGLAGRRALEERLPGLGPAYTIAMVDVDHFKQFNDMHGHDIGDQVLKLVAARLGTIEGGGTAYRYGGEEFAVLFPNRRLEDALPHLEDMRGSIEYYRMAVRGPNRPSDPEAGSQLRGRKSTENTLSVTVSIGAAQRDELLTTPPMVLRAADKALYRAKQSGRNRVCT